MTTASHRSDDRPDQRPEPRPAQPQHFRDYRGLLQLRLQSADDLEHLHTLEAARWSATSVPLEDLFADPVFLRMLDTDGNGRVRVRDLQDAHRWATERLQNLEGISQAREVLRAADLREDHPDTPRLRALMRQRLGTGETASLVEVRAFAETYKRRFPNGDGVVTPDHARAQGRAAAAELAALVVQFRPDVLDVSGDAGANAASLDAFLDRARALLAWETSRDFDETQARDAEAADALAAKLEQFFAQCDLVGARGMAPELVSSSTEGPPALDLRETAAIRSWLRDAPLARSSAEAELLLSGWLNPMFADELRAAMAGPLPRILGVDGPLTRLTRAQWERARSAIAPALAHRAARPAALPTDLHGASLRALLDGDAPAQLRALMEEDLSASAELRGLAELERLVLSQRWLLELANNMVSFPTLFQIKGRCLFEAGTLVLDGRELSFCLRVTDRASHKSVADTSNIFVVYVDLERTEGEAVRRDHVMAAVTAGTRGGIAVGKRGVFYDREGREWDARVADIVAHPISLWEAAISPFVRMRDFVVERVEKLTSARLDTMTTEAAEKTAAAVTSAPSKPGAGGGGESTVPPAAQPSPPAPAPPAAASGQGGGLQGLLVGGGIAFAAIGSAAAFVIQTLAKISPLDAVAGVVSVAGSIMLLSGFLGWLKLRRRDLSTLLEANGWAFNVRITLTRKHALRFTQHPPLAKDSVRERVLLPAVESGEGTDGRAMRLLAILAVLTIAAALIAHEPLLGWLLAPKPGPSSVGDSPTAPAP